MRLIPLCLVLTVCLRYFSVVAQTLTSSNLPVLLINTNGQAILDEPKIIAQLQIIDNGVGKRNNVTDKPAFVSKIGIEMRGATSQDFFPKKPYGIELRDTSGVNSVNASLLGMPSESDWVLNATYNDKTLIRETLTYDLNRQMSLYYTPRYRYCEVILNGNYAGVYILFEKIKRDKNRVNIASIKKTDVSGDALTGGYIFKIDKTEGSPSRSWNSPYTTNGRTIPIQIDRPKPEDLAEEQFQYARKFMTDFENTLKGATYQDSLTGYRKYINDDSFVDYLLLTEICKNPDAYRLSTFFYKDRDSNRGGKLTMGPIWDYNLAYGNINYCPGGDYKGWVFDFTRSCPTDGFQMPFWWDRLLSDRAFASKVRIKYQALRKNTLRTERIQAHVDSVATELTEARTRNFQRWPVIGAYVWPNGYVGQTYQQEMDYLKNWIKQRLDWLDTAVSSFGANVLATESVTAFDLTISPNPSTNDVIVRYQLLQRADLHITIIDATGKVIGNMTWPNQAIGEHQKTLPAHFLPSAPGVYFLKLDADGQPVSRKLLRL